MLYQCALCTTVPQRIRHKDPHGAAECERLEERATLSAANHDCTGCHRKAPLYAGQSVSVINNDRTLWLPATVVHAANHGSYIIKVIGRAEYRQDAVKPDMHPEVEVSPLHQPQKLYSYSKHPLLPQYNHLLPPQHPSKLQPKALQQQPTPSGRHLQLQMFNHRMAELLSHLTDLVVSVRHHNALLSICKYQLQ